MIENVVMHRSECCIMSAVRDSVVLWFRFCRKEGARWRRGILHLSEVLGHVLRLLVPAAFDGSGWRPPTPPGGERASAAPFGVVFLAALRVLMRRSRCAGSRFNRNSWCGGAMAMGT